MNAVHPAASLEAFLKENRPSLMKFESFPEYLRIAHENVHVSTQISPNILNLWVFLRDTPEILKIHVLGLILLLNPNKYGINNYF